MERIEKAMKHCATFQRCRLYPRDDEGVIALAEGLLYASDRTGIPMERIVAECKDISSFCPTDADLLRVAFDVKGPEKAPDLPKQAPEEISRAWQAFAHRFPNIRQNGAQWHRDFERVCQQVREKMGMEAWMKTGSSEKVRTALEMGLSILHQPQSMNDCGLGIFVRRREI